jgi:hypothetical protein
MLTLGGFHFTYAWRPKLNLGDNNMPQGLELIIEEAIMNDPGKLGYKGAPAIRNVRIAPNAGRIDVILLPSNGRRLVLIETKQSSASDAAAKVTGQLLMYYAGALNFSIDGLEIIRKFAIEHPDEAQKTGWISAQRICGGLSKLKAWKRLQSPRKNRLQPTDIDLFIAVDGKPKQSLIDTVNMLNVHHNLGIKIVTVENGKVTSVRLPYGSKMRRI